MNWWAGFLESHGEGWRQKKYQKWWQKPMKLARNERSCTFGWADLGFISFPSKQLSQMIGQIRHVKNPLAVEAFCFEMEASCKFHTCWTERFTAWFTTLSRMIVFFLRPGPKCVATMSWTKVVEFFHPFDVGFSPLNSAYQLAPGTNVWKCCKEVGDKGI